MYYTHNLRNAQYAYVQRCKLRTLSHTTNRVQSTFEANFYVEREDKGKPLAASVVRQLKEMNTDPTGSMRLLSFEKAPKPLMRVIRLCHPSVTH